MESGNGVPTITIVEKNKSPFLTNEELTTKIYSVHNSYTKEEKVQDKLIEVLSFLIAQRDGHKHKLTIGQVIKTTKDVLEDIGLIF